MQELVTIPNDIINKIEEEKNIKKFEGNLFFDSSYLLCILFMIKLPFLQLSDLGFEFQTLSELIKRTLEDKKLRNIDWNLSTTTVNELDKFIEEMKKDNSDQITVEKFYNKFEINNKGVEYNED